MIQLEHIGEGKLRFAIKDPSIVEIVWMDGKLFAHSSPFPTKSPTQTTPPGTINKLKDPADELSFLKETKPN